MGIQPRIERGQPPHKPTIHERIQRSFVLGKASNISRGTKCFPLFSQIFCMCSPPKKTWLKVFPSLSIIWPFTAPVVPKVQGAQLALPFFQGLQESRGCPLESLPVKPAALNLQGPVQLVRHQPARLRLGVTDL